MTTINDFFNIVLSLIELLEHLLPIEKDKLKAVTSNNLDALNNCMKNEQAHVLKLKGLDKKREQIQADLGYEKLTFKEILDRLPSDQKEEGKRLFTALQGATSQFNEVNDSIKTALDVNMHLISTTLSKLGINPDTKQTPSGNNLKNRFA